MTTGDARQCGRVPHTRDLIRGQGSHRRDRQILQRCQGKRGIPFSYLLFLFSLLRCCCNDEVTNHSLTITIIHFLLFFSFLDVLQTTDRSLIWNTDLVETLELRNLLGNASATMHAAEVSILYRPLPTHLTHLFVISIHHLSSPYDVLI